ncbi:MAG TPA: 16S rRNA (uracil(1498)-N(3))-methyltransferase [Candidatus Binatia bacterium]|jgi:RsmE family RNA methyltransferase
MNLVLVDACEIDGNVAVLRDRRARHILEVHRAEAGRTLKVGVLGGRIGTGLVRRADDEAVELEIALDTDPPAPLACTLVLALPRPRVMHRVLAGATSFGVKRIVLIGSQRVEKSYWKSPVLADEAIHRELVAGLEQGCDTMLPVVSKHVRFRPFVEDELAPLCEGTLALVAHPRTGQPCPRADGAPVTLVVGPEGGFNEFELGMLESAGLRSVTLGPRPLRVENAIAALLGRLF